MRQAGIKVTTYFSERDRSGERFLADALLDVYEHHKMHTSVLLRGVEGFGQHHHLQTDRLLTLSENLPAVSIAVDARDRVEGALPDILEVASHGLISLERADLLTARGHVGVGAPRRPRQGDQAHRLRRPIGPSRG